MASLKQKKLATKIANMMIGNEPTTSQKKVLLDAGYSENTAIKPSQVLESESFKRLLDKALKNKQVTKVHKEALNATYKNEPDWTNRLRAVDMAYKIKGQYPTDKHEHTILVPKPLLDVSAHQIEQESTSFEN